jgi:hypothetical protein
MPETTGYMLLGYALTIIIILSLVGYLVLMRRNLRAELETLESLAEENKIPGESNRVETPATNREHVTR